MSNGPQSATLTPSVEIHYKRVKRNKTKCQLKLYQRQSLKTSEKQLLKALFEENITQFKRRLRGGGYPDNLIENTLRS